MDGKPECLWPDVVNRRHRCPAELIYLADDTGLAFEGAEFGDDLRWEFAVVTQGQNRALHQVGLGLDPVDDAGEDVCVEHICRDVAVFLGLLACAARAPLALDGCDEVVLRPVVGLPSGEEA
ncbi:hypothetical protein SPURM210S_01722 [Streptomyces purpurascens]